MSNKLSHISIEIISAVLIFLFVYAGGSKLSEWDHFSVVLSESPLIGAANATLFARLIPSIELIIAFMLFLPDLRKWGFIGSVILMAVFTFYVAYMIIFTPQLPCSCGGVIAQMTWKQHLIFNIFFTTLSIVGLYLYQRNKLFIAINRSSRIPV